MARTPPCTRKRPSRGKYKRYKNDPGIAIPRTTFYRMRKQAGIVTSRKRHTTTKPTIGPRNQQLSKEESLIVLMSLNERPGVNKTTFASFLEALALHFEESKRPRHIQSIHKFFVEKRKCFKHGDIITKLHHVCHVCFYLFENDEVTCPTPGCGKSRYKDGTSDPVAFFLELDAEQQIKDFFTDERFVDALAYRFTLPDDGCIRDIYDGDLYKKHKEFLSHRYNLSLTWHTDGVEIYDSSIGQLWPLQAVINELPPSMRFSKKNLLLLGLYFGPGKPEMVSFMTPFVLALNKMFTEGSWYLMQFRSDKTYESCTGHKLIAIGKVDGALEVGGTATVKYNGKDEICDIVQRGRTRKEVWSLQDAALNGEVQMEVAVDENCQNEESGNGEKGGATNKRKAHSNQNRKKPSQAKQSKKSDGRKKLTNKENAPSVQEIRKKSGSTNKGNNISGSRKLTSMENAGPLQELQNIISSRPTINKRKHQSEAEPKIGAKATRVSKAELQRRQGESRIAKALFQNNIDDCDPSFETNSELICPPEFQNDTEDDRDPCYETNSKDDSRALNKFEERMNKMEARQTMFEQTTKRQFQDVKLNMGDIHSKIMGVENGINDRFDRLESLLLRSPPAIAPRPEPTTMPVPEPTNMQAPESLLMSSPPAMAPRPEPITMPVCTTSQSPLQSQPLPNSTSQSPTSQVATHTSMVSGLIPQWMINTALRRGTITLATRELCVSVFTEEVLAVSTVKGRTTKGSMKGEKCRPLDPAMVKEVESVILQHFPTHPEYRKNPRAFIRKIMSELCRDKAKKAVKELKASMASGSRTTASTSTAICNQTSPNTGTSPNTATSPNTGTSANTANCNTAISLNTASPHTAITPNASAATPNTSAATPNKSATRNTATTPNTSTTTLNTSASHNTAAAPTTPSPVVENASGITVAAKGAIDASSVMSPVVAPGSSVLSRSQGSSTLEETTACLVASAAKI